MYFYSIPSNFCLFALTVNSAPHKTTIFKLGAVPDSPKDPFLRLIFEMYIMGFADEEPWARQALKYITNFPTSDTFISCCQKTKPATTMGKSKQHKICPQNGGME